MQPFKSIEGRHGVNEPGYEPPRDEPVALHEGDKHVGPVEIIGSLLVPIAGIVFAIMRFADNEVGPGLACLLTGIVGMAGWLAVLGVA
jgi:hypothetical protein